jgi:hypothetical protein
MYYDQGQGLNVQEKQGEVRNHLMRMLNEGTQYSYKMYLDQAIGFYKNQVGLTLSSKPTEPK